MVDTEQDIDEDTAEDIQEDFEQADEDVSTGMRVTAGIQLAIIFAAFAAALVLAVTTGIISPSIVISATVNIGWVVEYFIIGLLAAFALYIFTLIIIVLPGSVLNLLGGLAYGAAVAAGLVEKESENN